MNDAFKGTVPHFRKIGGCLDGHYIVFISPRCREPVDLTKNLAPNCLMSFGAANSCFFKNALALKIKNYIINTLLDFIYTFHVKGSTSKRSLLVYNPCLTVYTNKCKTTCIYKQLFKSASSISLSNGNPSCALNF